MMFPRILDKKGRSKGANYPKPLQVLIAIVLTTPFGAHALHYGSIYYSFGKPVRELFFTSWMSFIGFSFFSGVIVVIFVWNVLYLQLRLYSALQYLIGGVILGVVIAVGAKSPDADFLLMVGFAITLNSWMFFVFAFWGITQEQEEGGVESVVDNYYLPKAEEAFEAGCYQEAIDNFEAAVSQISLSERHMMMYQKAKKHLRKKDI